jgi:hypothetical protein
VSSGPVAARRFRFRPRYRGVAAVAMGVGSALGAAGVVWGGAVLSFPIVTGVAGIALGAAYLLSPTWRLAVVADDAGLAVMAGDRTKLRVAWGDIVRVVASPTTHTCFIDGGEPARSLLVPGDGAPAPYAIEDRAALYDLVVARVDPAKITTVETLESVMARSGTDRRR